MHPGSHFGACRDAGQLMRQIAADIEGQSLFGCRLATVTTEFTFRLFGDSAPMRQGKARLH